MSDRRHGSERVPFNSLKDGLLAAQLSALPPSELIPDARETPLPALDQRARLATAVTRHHQLVWRTLRRFGVPERDTADAAQQVFLALAPRIAEVSDGKVSSYLVAIAVRVAANARRKLERSPEVLSDSVETLPGAHTPEGLLDGKQLREELDRGLLTLPLEQRAVFVLFELEGFSLPEIAEALEIPLGTATSRLRRARGHFEAWAESRRAQAGDDS